MLPPLVPQFAEELCAYYAPGAWVPHCTLEMDLPDENVPKVIELCSDLDLPTEAHLVEVGLVEFRPLKELMSFPLGPAERSL